MPVFRVEKNKDYTVMSNYHLRDKNLSLKAKGLLSQMLSLPEDWDYTLSGLCCINKESKDAIRTAVNELERAGYITRYQTTGSNGKFSTNEYIIREYPVLDMNLENPLSENPTTESSITENPTQIKKEIKNKEKIITDSIPISIPSISVRKQEVIAIYREIIKDNIEYDYLICQFSSNKNEIDNILSLITETVCSSQKTICIAGDKYSFEFVQHRFLELRSDHIVYILQCMQHSTTKIHNIKKYLLAVLFNAPSTMDVYYTALARQDIVAGNI